MSILPIATMTIQPIATASDTVARRLDSNKNYSDDDDASHVGRIMVIRQQTTMVPSLFWFSSPKMTRPMLMPSR